MDKTLFLDKLYSLQVRITSLETYHELSKIILAKTMSEYINLNLSLMNYNFT